MIPDILPLPEGRGFLTLVHQDGSPFIDRRICNPKAARLLPCLPALSGSARPPKCYSLCFCYPHGRHRT